MGECSEGTEYDRTVIIGGTEGDTERDTEPRETVTSEQSGARASNSQVHVLADRQRN